MPHVFSFSCLKKYIYVHGKQWIFCIVLLKCVHLLSLSACRSDDCENGMLLSILLLVQFLNGIFKKKKKKGKKREREKRKDYVSLKWMSVREGCSELQPCLTDLHLKQERHESSFTSCVTSLCHVARANAGILDNK